MASQHYLHALDEWQSLLPTLRAMTTVFDQVAKAFTDCWDRGGKILFAGNGGSAADAMHFAEELVVRFNKDRRALAAIALLDPTNITCAGNDMGYDQVFSRQIDALGKPEDVFVAITTSGNSPNILRALDSARKMNMQCIGFLGKAGGKAKDLCHLNLIIPSATTARVQEAHKLFYHSLCVHIDEWALSNP